MSSDNPQRDRVTGRAAVPGPAKRGSTSAGRPVGVAPVGQPGSASAKLYRRRRIRPRWGRIALVGAMALVLLAGLAFGGGWLYFNQLNDDLKRVDPFAGITDPRPGKVTEGAINILLLGSDSRDPDNKAEAGKWRTDTMILLHISADHEKAYLISIPRDLYVYVPKSRSNPGYGGVKAKINAAFAWGGLPLVVQTFEGYSDVRIDHVVLIDFAGFQQVTDALGGVDLTIEQEVTSIHPPHRHFKAGPNHLNGAEALDYVRQRYQFAEGDFARMRHQQQFMKALMDQATSSGTLTSLSKLNNFLKSITAAMTVDQDFSLTGLALELRGVRGEDLTFLVNPHLGSQTIDGESVVVSDRDRASSLYEAVRRDTVSDWVKKNAPPAQAGGAGAGE